MQSGYVRRFLPLSLQLQPPLSPTSSSDRLRESMFLHPVLNRRCSSLKSLFHEQANDVMYGHKAAPHPQRFASVAPTADASFTRNSLCTIDSFAMCGLTHAHRRATTHLQRAKQEGIQQTGGNQQQEKDMVARIPHQLAASRVPSLQRKHPAAEPLLCLRACREREQPSNKNDTEYPSSPLLQTSLVKKECIFLLENASKGFHWPCSSCTSLLGQYIVKEIVGQYRRNSWGEAAFSTLIEYYHINMIGAVARRAAGAVARPAVRSATYRSE